jgi:hypothetical protein
MNKFIIFLSLFISFSSFALEGEVAFVKGTATLADKPLDTLKVKDKISSGSTLKTGKNSFIRVRFPGGLVFQLGSESELLMNVPEISGSSLELKRGDLLTYLKPDGKKAERLKIKSPSATMGVRGTVLWVTSRPTQPEVLCTCEGEVKMSAFGEEKTFITKKHESPVEIKAGFPMPNKQLLMDGHNDQDIAELKKL